MSSISKTCCRLSLLSYILWRKVSRRRHDCFLFMTFNPRLSLPLLLLLDRVLIRVTTPAIHLFSPWLKLSQSVYSVTEDSFLSLLVLLLPFFPLLFFHLLPRFGGGSVSFSFMLSVMKKKLSVTLPLFLFLLPALQLLSEEPVWACRWAVPLRRHSQPVCEGQRVPGQHRGVRAQRTCKFTHTHAHTNSYIQYKSAHKVANAGNLAATRTHYNEKLSPIYIFSYPRTEAGDLKWSPRSSLPSLDCGWCINIRWEGS